MKFKGSFINVPLEPAIDPVANGVRLLIRDRAEAARIDVTIAGGAYDRRTRAGWRVNGRGTVWKYKSSGAVARLTNGIERVRLRRSATSAGKIQFSVEGRNGDYPIDENALPLIGILVMDPPFATTGQCGEVTFPAGAGRRYGCRATRGGDVVRCK